MVLQGGGGLKARTAGGPALSDAGKWCIYVKPFASAPLMHTVLHNSTRRGRDGHSGSCTYSGRVWWVNGQSKACLFNQVAMVRASGGGSRSLGQPLHPYPFHGIKQMGGVQKRSGASLPTCCSRTCNRIREVRDSGGSVHPAWKPLGRKVRQSVPFGRTGPVLASGWVKPRGNRNFNVPF